MSYKSTVLAAVAFCCLGCRNSQTSDRQRLQTAACSVFAEHHFAPPTVVQGVGGAMLVLSARPRSETAIDIARAEADPSGRVTVQILTYQYGPSEWAVLGRMFTGDATVSEGANMQRVIGERVGSGRQTPNLTRRSSGPAPLRIAQRCAGR